MPAGRKPKPTALKQLMGNPGRRPINKNEPRPPVSCPEPPLTLNARARAEWRAVCPRLASIGLMTDLDITVLAAYCSQHAIWSQALEDYDALAARDPSTHGAVYRTVKGNMMQNPLLSVINTAEARMLAAAAELGMTPSARSRMNVSIGTLPTAAGADGDTTQPATPASTDAPKGTARFFH